MPWLILAYLHPSAVLELVKCSLETLDDTYRWLCVFIDVCIALHACGVHNCTSLSALPIKKVSVSVIY